MGLVGAAAVGALVLRENHPPSLDANLIAVAPFDVFDPKLALWREGLVDILSRTLDGAGPLRAVSPGVAMVEWPRRASRGEGSGRPDGRSACAVRAVGGKRA